MLNKRNFEITSSTYNKIWSSHSSSLVLIFHQEHHSAWQTRLYGNQAEQSIEGNTLMIVQIDLVETMCLRKTERRTSRSSLLRKRERSLF